MELKPNMYVRTKYKGIVKIDEVIENGVEVYEDDYGNEWEKETGRKVIRYIDKDGWNCGLDENEIIKASHNIIDLIEVSDLVNGFRVDNVYNPTGNEILWFKLSCNPLEIWDNKDIKTIVTKEQLEAMQYKVVQE